jgi:hypothetical protein
VANRQITRDDVSSMVGARRELGEDLEPEVVDAFLARVETAIDARVDERLERSAPRKRDRGHADKSLALAIVSLGTGIPITAIAAESGGVLGMVVAWLGIVGVNGLYARSGD